MDILEITPVDLDKENNELILLDQTLLPNEEKYIRLKDKESIWEAIYKLKVRGAPAIGIAAAIGIYVCINESIVTDFDGLYKEFKGIKEFLASSRPTAVNLFWALDRMEASSSGEPPRSRTAAFSSSARRRRSDALASNQSR